MEFEKCAIMSGFRRSGHIYFVKSQQYWLEIAKLKKVFRSTINPCTKIIPMYLTESSTQKLTDWLAYLLMP